MRKSEQVCKLQGMPDISAGAAHTLLLTGAVQVQGVGDFFGSSPCFNNAWLVSFSSCWLS